VLGLITPTSGTAAVKGHNMSVANEMRAGVHYLGAVLEGARNAYWRLSILENLRYFGGLRGMVLKEVDEKAVELLSILNLLEYQDQEVRKLSRGMQQKVAIANALMHDPEILVLDEPTLGLDVEAARLLEETIVRLVQRGKAIILTTHVMSLAERLADRIFVINDGKQVAYDDTQVLLRQFDTRTTVEIKTQQTLPSYVWEQVSHRFPSIIKRDAILEWVEPEQHQIVSLYQLLDQVGGITVLSITHREPKLEEVFLSLTRRVSPDGVHA
ncbi:MAG: ABC transporter ATP-binding protein, partial [Anaerolineales bacterium]|nr:ABC transporter ATP-binding protein [Anaerolineales bacterium]